MSSDFLKDCEVQQTLSNTKKSNDTVWKMQRIKHKSDDDTAADNLLNDFDFHAALHSRADTRGLGELVEHVPPRFEKQKAKGKSEWERLSESPLSPTPQRLKKSVTGAM